MRYCSVTVIGVDPNRNIQMQFLISVKIFGSSSQHQKQYIGKFSQLPRFKMSRQTNIDCTGNITQN